MNCNGLNNWDTWMLSILIRMAFGFVVVRYIVGPIGSALIFGLLWIKRSIRRRRSIGSWR